MKAYLIARVSTADQVDALPAQVYRLTDYAQSKGYGYELFKFQESAFKGARDKFRAIINRIEECEEQVIVVFDKVDRFTRDSSAHETHTLKQLYLTGKIELHFPSENLFLNERSSSTEKMRLGLNTVFAEYYSNAISDNVRRRNDQLWRDGIWTSPAPFGYKNITRDDGSKWIELVPLQARAVKTAFEAYATGSYSLKTIRFKIIKEYGLTLTSAQWDRILKNPFYTGVMRIKGELYPHKYETVIDEALFNQAKAVREGYAVQPRRWAGLPYQYRGLITCAECGCRVTFEKKKGRYVYGHCTQYNGKHGAAYVSEDDMTDQLRQVFNQVQLPEDAYEEVVEALKADDQNANANNAEKLNLINTEIKKCQTRIDRNYDMYLDAAISRETYQRKHEELQASKAALENSRKNIELMPNDNFDSVLSLLKLSRMAPTIFENAEIEEKRTMINMVLSNLELDDKELRWKLKKPYDTMAFCNETQNWLGMRDSNPRSRDQNPLPYHLANPHWLR